ncbi:MAG: PaaI family thioesterase [Acidobacteriota bacterium]
MTSSNLRPDLSGLEFFQKLVSGELPHPPMLELLGLRMTEVDLGRAVFTAVAEERFYNGTGVAHGGFAAALLDSALGCAINSTMPPGKRFTTLELKINLTRPLQREAGALRCEAHVVHLGGRVATSEGRITDRNGKLYAHGTTTCIVVEAPRGVLEP